MVPPASQCAPPESPSKKPIWNEEVPAGAASSMSSTGSLSVTRRGPEGITRNLASVVLQLGKHLNCAAWDCAPKVKPNSASARGSDVVIFQRGWFIVLSSKIRSDPFWKQRVRSASAESLHRKKKLRAVREKCAVQFRLEASWSRAVRNASGDQGRSKSPR